jgi:hypothetical protein
MINEVGWDKLIAIDWKFSFEISLKALLHSLPIDDGSLKNK